MGNENNLEILTTVLKALQNLDKESQIRTLKAAITFLDISPLTQEAVSYTKDPQRLIENPNTAAVQNAITFSENRLISAKEFMRDKAPTTDIERIACLAYYATHYRDLPHFKTIDLSTINMEAALPKFSNAAASVDNATRAGLLAPAVKGTKQLSAAGELFVQKMPDREAARTHLSTVKVKKRPKKVGLKSENSSSNEVTDPENTEA